MYDLLVELYKESPVFRKRGPLEEPLWLMANNEGLTPFTLSAKNGSTIMFQHLLELRRRVRWTYGPVTCVYYPLEEWDTLCPRQITLEDGDEEFCPTALQLIIENRHTQLLMLPKVCAAADRKHSHACGDSELEDAADAFVCPLQMLELLNVKWKRRLQKRFLWRLFW